LSLPVYFLFHLVFATVCSSFFVASV
jgi:hypothetical protein